MSRPKANATRGLEWARLFAARAPDLPFRLWPDIGERLKNEFSLVDSRMRQLQFIPVDFHIAKIEEIDIDLARDIALVMGRAAKRDLNCRQLIP